MAFRDDLKKRGYTDQQIKQLVSGFNQPTGKSKKSLADYAPLIGGVLGSILLPGLGTVLGGALGSAGGAGVKQLIKKEDVNFGEIAKEGAFGLAGGVAGKGLGAAAKLLGAGGKAATEAGGKNALTSLGRSMAKLPLKPDVPSGIGSLAAQDEIVTGLRNLGIKGTPNQMRSQIAKMDTDLNTEISGLLSKETKTLSNKQVSNLFKKAVSSTDAFDASDPLYKRLTSRTANRFLGKGKEFTATDIFKIKKELNGELTKAYEKLKKGGNLTSAEEVKMVLRDNLDDFITSEYSGVKQQTLTQSFLRSAVTGIEKAAESTAKLPLLNIPLPGVAQLGQTIAGAAGRGFETAGAKLAVPFGPLGLASQQAAGQTAVRPGLLGSEELPQEQLEEPGLMDQLPLDQPEQPSSMGLTEDELMQLVMFDLQNPASKGKNINQLKELYEMMNPQQKEKKLSPAAVKDVANAESGLRAIQIIREELTKPGTLLKASIPGQLGARKFSTVIREVSDVITRIRTGAALSKSEEKFYRSQLPSLLDDPETIEQKLMNLEDLFSRVAAQGGGGGTDQADLLSQLGL